MSPVTDSDFEEGPLFKEEEEEADFDEESLIEVLRWLLLRPERPLRLREECDFFESSIFRFDYLKNVGLFGFQVKKRSRKVQLLKYRGKSKLLLFETCISS